jgi:hypothetical protein
MTENQRPEPPAGIVVIKGPISEGLMADLNAWGAAYQQAIYEKHTGDAPERVKFLVDEWRESRGPHGGGTFKDPAYDAYTAEEKDDAYGRLMSIISDGGG